MDYLKQNNLIENDTIIPLISNKLALIVPKDSLKTPRELKDLNDSYYHHIALGNETVPAGKMARIALKKENVWNENLSKKIVNADNVRIALSWVASHEASVGVVYQTDAKIEERVKIAFILNDQSYPKIIYPASILKNSKNKKLAKRFIDLCKSPLAKKIFENAGFIVL